MKAQAERNAGQRIGVSPWFALCFVSPVADIDEVACDGGGGGHGGTDQMRSAAFALATLKVSVAAKYAGYN